MAVKTIPKKTIQHQQEAYRRFMRETRNLRQLRHKNIVRLHEVMETRANYYLVMEVLDGQNLKTYIQKRFVFLKSNTQRKKRITRVHVTRRCW